MTFVEACLQPKRFRLNAVVRQMYEVWIRALVIVGVLTFLIGVVIAYQGVQQLKQFGAETFTVEAVGIGMFRELGVLLTAIIVAGRSGSAFTAQIGTMQVNQEVDAMRTIGLNPIEWLVLPRISALVISMPLLAFWGDMTGLLGGAVACTVYLDFTFVQFFERLRDTVGVWHFYVGMIKAPVFGAVIAIIGCFEGLQVTRQRRERRSAHHQVGGRIDLLRDRARRDVLDHLPAGERVMADTAAPAKEHAEKPAPPKLFEGGQLVDHRDGRDVVLKLRGVRTQFGDNIIHDNLDFDVFRGEIIGLVGGSGTGKSVLLRTIIGLNQHTKGTIEMLGVDTATLHGKEERAMQARTGVQFQDGALFSSLSVTENIIVPVREHAGLEEQTMRDIAALKVAMVGLPAGRRRQEAFGAFRRHAQARQPGPRPGARPGAAVPRRADRRSRPDRRGALRRAGQGPEQEPWRHDSHGDARSGQPLCGLRSHRRVARQARRGRYDGRVAGVRSPLGPGIFPWTARAGGGPEGSAGVERRQMERRSPYVLIGAAMILFIAAVAGFVIWKLRAGDRTAYAYYDILFSGDVQGLTTDSPVFYRGLRVGRVSGIQLTSRVDTQRSTGRERLSEKIEVTVAVDWNIDIRERSYAVFEKPFIAGAPFIQIVGRLDVDQIKPKKKLGDKPYPEIREGASFLQATSTSAQELLTKAGVTVDRLNELLSPDNVGAVADTLRNLSTLSTALAKQDGAIQATLAELPIAIAEFRKTFDKVNTLSDSLNVLALELGPQDAATKKALAGKEPSELQQDHHRGARGAEEHRQRGRPAQQAGRRQQGAGQELLRGRPHRAVDDHPRAASAHRQSERHRYPARARSGGLRLQRQAGIHA